MAWNPVPTALFAGMSEDGTDITLPIAALPELTAVEADAASGDSRKVLFAICERAYNWFTGLLTADKPTMLTIAKTSSISAAGVVTHTYTFTFKNTIASQDVAPEA